MKRVFYFGLEPLKARYTYQLSKEWMPNAFAEYSSQIEFVDVPGEFDPDQQIKVGAVLDAVGRGKFAMSQCSNFLDMLNRDEVREGDVIFLQDYWHPGIESILYALDLYGIKVELYAMLHAQSVDEYDFTYPMAPWMRGFELGLDNRMTGIFVGSTIHKEQLRSAGFKAPIHVVSLPLDLKATMAKLPNFPQITKSNTVVYSSRLDKEKNPFFMMQVAKEYLSINPNWEWHVTTSGKEFKSMLPGVIEALEALAAKEPRFKLLKNLSKEQYYTELASAKIQFNSSLQDYVSWTVLESMTFDCTPVFPDFRSFPELITESYLYKAFDVASAIHVLEYAAQVTYHGKNLPVISDTGRRLEAYIVANGIEHEVNIWHEYEYIKHLLESK